MCAFHQARGLLPNRLSHASLLLAFAPLASQELIRHTWLSSAEPRRRPEGFISFLKKLLSFSIKSHRLQRLLDDSTATARSRVFAQLLAIS